MVGTHDAHLQKGEVGISFEGSLLKINDADETFTSELDLKVSSAPPRSAARSSCAALGRPPLSIHG